MKKLKLNPSNFLGGEVLSREELKKVMGGSGSEQCWTEEVCCDASGNVIDFATQYQCQRSVLVNEELVWETYYTYSCSGNPGGCITA